MSSRRLPSLLLPLLATAVGVLSFRGACAQDAAEPKNGVPPGGKRAVQEAKAKGTNGKKESSQKSGSDISDDTLNNILGVISQSMTEEGNPDVVWEKAPDAKKSVVLLKPCELRFSPQGPWMPAPKAVFDPAKHPGFMMGRLGMEDKNGKEIMPTITVIWDKVDYDALAEDRPKGVGKDNDPLFFFSMQRRPDLCSKGYTLERIFLWENGPVTMRYATGWQYHTEFNGRPSKAIAVYTLHRGKKLGIQILAEIPEELWPKLQNEVEAILKSFQPTSPEVFGEREAFLAKTKDGLKVLDFRNRGEKSPDWSAESKPQFFRKEPSP